MKTQPGAWTSNAAHATETLEPTGYNYIQHLDARALISVPCPNSCKMVLTLELRDQTHDIVERTQHTWSLWFHEFVITPCLRVCAEKTMAKLLGISLSKNTVSPMHT